MPISLYAQWPTAVVSVSFYIAICIIILRFCASGSVVAHVCMPYICLPRCTGRRCAAREAPDCWGWPVINEGTSHIVGRAFYS